MALQQFITSMIASFRLRLTLRSDFKRANDFGNIVKTGIFIFFVVFMIQQSCHPGINGYLVWMITIYLIVNTVKIMTATGTGSRFAKK
jgi:uncharacterized membrane protein